MVLRTAGEGQHTVRPSTKSPTVAPRIPAAYGLLRIPALGTEQIQSTDRAGRGHLQVPRGRAYFEQVATGRKVLLGAGIHRLRVADTIESFSQPWIFE